MCEGEAGGAGLCNRIGGAGVKGLRNLSAEQALAGFVPVDAADFEIVGAALEFGETGHRELAAGIEGLQEGHFGDGDAEGRGIVNGREKCVIAVC